MNSLCHSTCNDVSGVSINNNVPLAEKQIENNRTSIFFSPRDKFQVEDATPLAVISAKSPHGVYGYRFPSDAET